MYNQELKERYIHEKESSTIVPPFFLKSTFNKLSKYEKELGKDVSNFTRLEIIEYYKISNFVAIESVATVNSALSQYSQWCLEQNLVVDNQNHFLEIDRPTMNNVVNKYLINKRIVTRDRIEEMCSEMINPRDKFVLLCLFEGIKGKEFCEIANLRLGDIKDLSATLCTGRTIPISPLLKEYAMLADDIKIYYSVTGNFSKNMLLKSSGVIFKDYPNTSDDISSFERGRIIYNALKRSLKQLGMFQFLSASSIADSGKIHMIKKRAEELSLTPKEYINSPYIKEVEKQFNCTILKTGFYMKYEEHLK